MKCGSIWGKDVEMLGPASSNKHKNQQKPSEQEPNAAGKPVIRFDWSGLVPRSGTNLLRPQRTPKA
jgi:hypothetical protein